MTRLAATAAATAAATTAAVAVSAVAASASASAVPITTAGRRVCFLTDVEGSWSYVRNFARQSSCLLLASEGDGGNRRADGANSTHTGNSTSNDNSNDTCSMGGDVGTGDGETLQLRDDCMLVFGGDAGDKGDDTLRGRFDPLSASKNRATCYEQLVRLKKRHPERVVLLVGNRDVNKMRLTSELADSELELHAMAREVRDGPLWVPPDRRVTIADFLARQVAASDAAATTTNDADAIVSTTAATGRDAGTDTVADRLRAANTKVNRLKWMLEHTMGAQGDFERRRGELAARGARRSRPGPNDGGGVVASAGAAAVDDESVLQSYVESVREGGAVREYLELGSLAFIAHGTLFTHGGVLRGAGGDESESALGRVPGRPSAVDSLGASSAPSVSRPASAPPSASSSSSSWSSPEERRSDVAAWVQELNAWYRQQVQQWIEQPTWSADRSHRGGSELLEYVLPDHPASVVMGRHLQASGMPAQLPSAVAQTLAANDIRRLVVGHTPHGTCPTVIKQQTTQSSTSAQAFACSASFSTSSSSASTTGTDTDTSTSTDADSNTDDTFPLATCGRGFEEVIMCDTSYSDMAASDNRGGAAAELVVEADGRARVHGVLSDGRAIAYASDDPLIGRALRDGTQVKAKLRDAGAAEAGGSAGRSTSPPDSDSQAGDEYLVYSVANGFSYTYHYRTRAEVAAIGFAD